MYYTKTVGMTKADWLKERQQGIGGSDVAALLGISKYKTPLEVFLDKTSETPVEIEDNPKMKAGRMLEQVVAEWFQDETGYKVIRDNKIREHKEHPFLIANLDRVILPTNGEGRGVLECKSTSSFAINNWEDEIPVEYYAQLQHYLNVTGYNWGVVAVLANGWDFKYYRYEKDDEFISQMNERLIDFWENLEKGIMPEPTTSEEIKIKYPASTESKIEVADNDTLILFETLKQKKIEEKDLKEEIGKLNVQIQNKMKDAEELRHNDQLLIRWKSYTQNRFQSKEFKKAHPDMYSEFTAESTVRKFEPIIK